MNGVEYLIILLARWLFVIRVAFFQGYAVSMQRKASLLIMNNISAEWLSMERNECVCFKFYEVGINLPRIDYRVVTTK